MPDGTPASAPQSQPQAPFGNTAATQPSPNRGHEAAGLQKLGVVIQQLAEVLPLVGATSEIGQFITDTIKKGAKFIPAGAVTPQAQNNQLQQMAIKNGQNNQQMQMLRQGQQQAQQKAA